MNEQCNSKTRMGARAASAAIAAMALAVGPAPLAAQEMRPALTTASAQAIVAGCAAMARENGWPVSIAVADSGGNVMAFLRLDSAPVATGEVALWKAKAAALYRMSTEALGGYLPEMPGLTSVPDMAAVPGGEPISAADGQPLGGVGVSGAAASDDVRCGKAGIATAGLGGG